MKYMALSLVLAMLGGTVWYSSAQYRADQEVLHSIFDKACEITYYDCTEVERPTVRRSEQVEDNKLHGIYMGGNVIWIEKNREYTKSVLTIFHEVVHYLQFTVGGIDPIMVSTAAGCVLEREAMEATNAFADYLGVPDYKRELIEWKKTYGCP